MTRRAGLTWLAVALAVFAASASLIAWRLWPRPAAISETANPQPEPGPAAEPYRTAKASTIIDLPGDPVLISRGAVFRPREVHFDLPVRIAANAPKVDSAGYFVSATMVSINGGFMGKFTDFGDEADALTAQIAMNSAAMSADAVSAAAAASDDDGGDATPTDAAQLWLTAANSNQMEVAFGEHPTVKQSLIKTVVAERISDILIAEGYSEESARAAEAASKSLHNVQTLPANSAALAYGALDASGAYRVAELAIWEEREYVGSVALFESGLYGEAARPSVPAGLIDDAPAPSDVGQRYTLADGLYSAGLRTGMPEAVVREAIQLIGRLVDLKAALPADEVFRALCSHDFRDRTKAIGKIVFVGLTGSAGQFDCYAFEGADGAYRCFDAKGGAAGGGAGAGAPASLGASGAASVGGVLAPIKGAPITSLFGMRFHPILHILRLHAGLDFGAPVGSPVRAAADGKVVIAGPLSGFGNHVRLEHQGFGTSYSHLSEIPASIRPGVEVKQGEIIALSGNTGLSTGPHLHFEFYINGVAVDPLPHLGKEVQAAAPTAAAPKPPTFASGAAFDGRPTEAEIAGFPAFKALVDAALDAAVH